MILDELHHHPGGNDPKQEHHAEVHTVKNLEAALYAGNHVAAEVAQGTPRSQARDLQPGRRPGGGKSPRKIELLGFFAAQFSAGSFWDAAWREQLHAIRRKPQSARHHVSHRGSESCAPRRITFAGLRNDDQFFRARSFVRQAECNDTSLADSIGARGKFLDFVRIQIAPALDDDVLHASRDVDFTVGAVRAVARVHPGVFPLDRCRAKWQERFRRFRIAVIPGGCRGAAKPEEPFRAVWNFVAAFIDNANFVARQCFSGRNKRDGRFVLRRRGHRASLRRKRLAFDAVNQWAAIQRRHGDRQRSFRQTVDGKLRFAAEAVTCETLRKTLERLRIHRFGAIQRRAPGAEIHALDIFVRDLAHTEFISKIRRRGDRAAIFVKRLQPALRARQESQRGHYRQGRAEEQQRKPRANQPHVVVQREPADADVLRPELDRFANGAHVCEQVFVREDDAFGVTR